MSALPQWSCEREYPVDGTKCVNEELLQSLAMIRKYYLVEGGKDDSHFITFAQACSSIKAYPRQISSRTEAQTLPHIDETIGALINQFLREGKIEQAEKWKRDKRLTVLRQFNKVQGVGQVTALKLYDIEGVRSIEELRIYLKSYNSLYPKVSMKYYDDTQKEMTRKDAGSIASWVQVQLDKIQLGGKIIICGGYRRGKVVMTDVDLILTYEEEGLEKGILKKLLKRLTEKGFIDSDDGILSQQHIATNRDTPHNRCATILDNLDRAFIFFRHPAGTGREETVRRVDLVISRIGSLGAATLAWTGSIQFNRDIRKIAKQKFHYSLDAGGLEDEKGNEIPCPTEESIFEKLGMKFIAPQFRNTDP